MKNLKMCKFENEGGCAEEADEEKCADYSMTNDVMTNGHQEAPG